MDTKQVQKIINPMIQQIRTSAFVPEYQDAASDEECLGLAISKFYEWDGYAIYKSFIEALNDANFHSFAGKIEDLATEEFKQ